MSDALAKGSEAKDAETKDEASPGHIRVRNRALILAAARGA